MRGGAVNYLLKPFGQDALRDRLERYAATHRSLDEISTAGQHEIDQLFGTPPREKEERLPKGLSRETGDLVRRALQEAPADLSASECGEAVGIARVSARRYLEHLATTRQDEVRLRYGAAGRPERRYVWRSP